MSVSSVRVSVTDVKVGDIVLSNSYISPSKMFPSLVLSTKGGWEGEFLERKIRFLIPDGRIIEHSLSNPSTWLEVISDIPQGNP